MSEREKERIPNSVFLALGRILLFTVVYVWREASFNKITIFPYHIHLCLMDSEKMADKAKYLFLKICTRFALNIDLFLKTIY